MVMVQVVITTEWFVINMPLQVKKDQLYPECDVAKETFLLLHVYPILLLVLTFLYGMSVFRSVLTRIVIKLNQKPTFLVWENVSNT